VEDGDLAAAVQSGAASSGEPLVVAAFAKDERASPRPRVVSDRRARVAELMRAHGDTVLGFCLRMLGDRALAEDVAQQVFLEAYRDLERFGGHASPLAWLFGIAYHRCLDALKSQQRQSKLIENNEQAVLDFEDPGAGPIEYVAGVRLTAALEECLKRLSDDMRATVLLRFQTGATYEELAVLLGATADTLQMRVARALPILRRCLEKKGWTGE
jgi:RNA polymerase sigma-70 factor (ECF subfamily)